MDARMTGGNGKPGWRALHRRWQWLPIKEAKDGGLQYRFIVLCSLLWSCDLFSLDHFSKQIARSACTLERREICLGDRDLFGLGGSPNWSAGVFKTPAFFCKNYAIAGEAVEWLVTLVKI
jgi:hypothetical protein